MHDAGHLCEGRVISTVGFGQLIYNAFPFYFDRYDLALEISWNGEKRVCARAHAFFFFFDYVINNLGVL